MTNERFWSKVNKNGPVPTNRPDLGPCWLWTAYRDGKGYGQFWGGSRPVRAHRFAYELLVGPIPSGLTLDHLCRVRHCVNTDHLEPVTNQENIRRGEAGGSYHRAKTHCLHGHPFDVKNTYHYKGRRYCRACQWASYQRHRQMAALAG